MVKETNLYANKEIRKKRESGEMKRTSRLQRWTNVTVKEMKKYIALVMNMGLDFKQNIVRYWTTYRSQRTPFYPETMSLCRFQAIRSMFHLDSAAFIPKGQPGHDPWYKVRKFYNAMNRYFKQYFVPGQNIAIDESMIGMKNRCSFIQYMANKRHARFGIKKYELCDSKTSYVLHSEMYSGKGFLQDNTQTAYAEKVVLHLLTVCNLLDKGYHLYTDNYYTKLPLAERLFFSKTLITGTINKRSKNLPKTVVNAKLGKEKSIYFRKNDTLLVGYRQKVTSKPVLLLSTALPADDKIIHSKKSGIEAMKPALINEYNLNMGAVDVKDKSLYHLTCTRPTKKYWKKIFDNFLDMALLNSYILYKNNSDNPLDRYNFTVNIIESLVSEASTPEPAAAQVIPGPSGDDGHSLTRLPGVLLRVCAVCSTSQKMTRSHFWCPGCNAGVHPACFHHLEHFWRENKRGRKRKQVEEESDSE